MDMLLFCFFIIFTLCFLSFFFFFFNDTATTEIYTLSLHDALPILRAGLGMLEAVTELFPEVAVGYIGLERDDVTLLPTSYYEKLPPIEGRHVLLLDPMLATGGSAAGACAKIEERHPAE